MIPLAAKIFFRSMRVRAQKQAINDPSLQEHDSMLGIMALPGWFVRETPSSAIRVVNPSR